MNCPKCSGYVFKTTTTTETESGALFWRLYICDCGTGTWLEEIE